MKIKHPGITANEMDKTKNGWVVNVMLCTAAQKS